jgi:hypothetical protein
MDALGSPRRSQRKVVIAMPLNQTWLSLLLWLTLVILGVLPWNKSAGY